MRTARSLVPLPSFGLSIVALLSCFEPGEAPEKIVATRQALVVDIHDCSELQAMEQNLSADYRLANDIDCTGFDSGDSQGWLPIGTSAPLSFDGDGHVITGLAFERWYSDHKGLFAYTQDATIERVGLIGIDFLGHENIGGLGTANNTTISECYVQGSLIGYGIAGGIAGAVNCGELRDSYAEVAAASGRRT